MESDQRQTLESCREEGRVLCGVKTSYHSEEHRQQNEFSVLEQETNIFVIQLYCEVYLHRTWYLCHSFQRNRSKQIFSRSVLQHKKIRKKSLCVHVCWVCTNDSSSSAKSDKKRKKRKTMTWCIEQSIGIERDRGRELSERE